MSDGVLTFKAFECDVAKIIKSRGLGTRGEVQCYIDSEVLRLSEPFIPKDSNALINSVLEAQTGAKVEAVPWMRQIFDAAEKQVLPQGDNERFENFYRTHAADDGFYQA